MHILRLDHLVITTQNLEKCLHFYVDILGMKLDERNGRKALIFGNQKINIHCNKEEYPPVALNVTYGSQDLCLIVEDDIHELKQKLTAKHVPIELGIVDRNGALGPMRSIYLRDPDGNLIELSQYPC